MSINTSSVPEFKIRELTGQRRTVILTQRGLPFRPLSMSGNQRVEVTTPPGAPDGISSVTGPTEEDTNIRGRWSDKYLGATTAITNNGFQVTNVIAAVRLFDDIRITGQLLQVSWGPIVRTGHMSKFGHNWDNIHDVDWDATFKWINRGNVSFTDYSIPAPGMSDTASGLSALLDQINSLLMSLPISPFSDEMSDLFAMSQKLRSLSDSIDRVTSGAVDLISSPFQIANSYRDALGGIVAVCSEFSEKIDSSFGSATGLYLDSQMQGSSISGESVLSSLLGNAMPSNVVDLLVPVQSQAMELKTTARDMRNLAIEAMRRVEDPEDEVLGTYVARQGDNLRDVSMAFYETPMQWRSLMMYNQLDSAELEVGDIIVVPRLDSTRDGR